MVKNIELSLDRAQSLVDYLNDNPTRAYAHEEFPNPIYHIPKLSN
jgi:hypothetical protein